jgi:tRNA modification GTPase
LLNENRAIVSDIAGTTRDTIEETLNINGILFRLVDTAGIREHTSDVIESIGVEKSLEKMRQADVVVYLFDANEMEADELTLLVNNFKEQSIEFLLVGNKADKAEASTLQNKFSSFDPVIFIAAKSGWNVDELKDKLVELVLHGSVQTEGTVVTNARHQHALQQVGSSLSDIHRGLDDRIPGDLLALDIRRCLHYLGEITGEISNEDRLDYIFSKFCIGK